MKTYLGQSGRFLLLLLTIQIVRGLIITGLWKALHPPSDSPTWAIMDMLAFWLVGIGLLFTFCPARMQLALGWQTASRRERMAYLGMGALALDSGTLATWISICSRSLQPIRA